WMWAACACRWHRWTKQANRLSANYSEVNIMALDKQTIFERAGRGELKAPQLIADFDGNNDGLENRTPIDNSVIGTLGAGGKAEVDAAVRAARACFESGAWRDLDPGQRKAIMTQWCGLLEAHSEELAALDCIDAGKPID